MTIVAALAAHESLGGDVRLVVFADSRASGTAGIEDGQDKIINVTSRCCAALAGPREPTLRLQELVDSELSRLSTVGGAHTVQLHLWECTGVLLQQLRAERQRLAIPDARETQLVVAGFMRNGTPAIAQLTLGGATEELFLYVPKEQEAVARVIGPAIVHETVEPFQENLTTRPPTTENESQPSDAVGVLAEALRIGIASGCQFDVAKSVLQDMAAHPSLPTIGGTINVGYCGASSAFAFTSLEATDFEYDASAYQRLDAQQQATPLFTGGAPLAHWIDLPTLKMGSPEIFQGAEPTFLASGGPVPAIVSAGDLLLTLLNQPDSGIAEQERASVELHRQRKRGASARTTTATKPPGGKRRRPRK